MLRTALQRAGYPNVTLAPLLETPLKSRRRVDLAVKRFAGAITLGLHRARSDEIIDMTECVLLERRILALLPPMRVLLRSIEGLRRTGSVIINWLDSGPDILLRLDADITGPDRTKMIAFAREHRALRISFAKGTEAAEPVAMLASPVMTLSGIEVVPPPGAFLQASIAGEAEIIKAVLAGLPKLTAKARIVELYAGIGTLSFALVPHGRIEAYEGAVDAVTAHELAIRRANLAGRMQVSVRDLNRRPLLIAEIAKAAVVVLDPPYAGAGAQMKNLAASGVKRIIYVSCNPDALATDAFALQRAGYEILTATPIDQFPYSENLESVVVFAKP
ncbi:MAG TPA: class I SAM-dependent RNA methyltransferase [Acidocella sp.]|nr:class I SAM-dependent RNA methyltransferase [Acidocella sp.]